MAECIPRRADPTAAQISQRCRDVQRSWTPELWKKRLVCPGADRIPWALPEPDCSQLPESTVEPWWIDLPGRS